MVLVKLQGSLGTCFFEFVLLCFVLIQMVYILYEYCGKTVTSTPVQWKRVEILCLLFLVNKLSTSAKKPEYRSEIDASTSDLRRAAADCFCMFCS
jgi:hypothetical protein